MHETMTKVVGTILDFLCDVTESTDYLEAVLGMSIFFISLVTIYCLLIFGIKKVYSSRMMKLKKTDRDRYISIRNQTRCVRVMIERAALCFIFFPIVLIYFGFKGIVTVIRQ